MNFNSFLVLIIITFSITVIQAQTLRGTVYEIDNDKKKPLTGVNVYWEGTQEGTTTDNRGGFSIDAPVNTHSHSHGHHHHHLIVSFVGYMNDTLHIERFDKAVEVVLMQTLTLDEVEIRARQSGTHISRINPMQTQIITACELTRAACCNLAESFETNASVDVNFSDAITGARQIQLLGLAGIYTQMMVENIPTQRGLANPFGLGYIPGTWMESIQISKGTSSVINGYESVSGQINVEFLKPHRADKLFLNLFASAELRNEANLTSAIRINDNLHTIILLHGSRNTGRFDHCENGFIDLPLVEQINAGNRWLYTDNKYFELRAGFNVLEEERIGGQLDYDFDKHYGGNQVWGFRSKTKRYEAYTKLGIMFPERPGKSIGIIANGSLHEQKSIFGMKNYFGDHKSFYSNIIYQNTLADSNLSLSVGSSYMYDNYNEYIGDSLMQKEESVPGVFLQLTYNISEAMTTIAGIRIDQNNLYGTFITPRIHTRFHLDSKSSLRLSAGKGYRSPAIFAENQHFLASSRQWVFLETPKHEEAWNYGINLTRDVIIGGREISLSTDYYRTEFINQVIIDIDQSARKLYVYNLDGKSFSNSFQIEATGEIMRNFDATLAYRFNEVKMTIDNILREKPLTSRYKALASISYLLPGEKWKIDFTTQFNGPGRIPSTEDNPLKYQRFTEFDAYVILLGQITYSLKNIDFYIGGENLTDFMQLNPIIANNDPFGNYFDASMIYGPIMGRAFYGGLRWKIL